MHCGRAALPAEGSAVAELPLLLHSHFGVTVAGCDRPTTAKRGRRTGRVELHRKKGDP